MTKITKMTKTRQIQNPTYYVEALNTEFAEFALDEERAEQFRGRWRQAVFRLEATKDINSQPLDLEIGTGHGLFFAHQAKTHPNRFLVGVEIKFKPLIQAIRRVINFGSKNARIVRYHAAFIDNIFAPREIDDIYIHHPDPWTKRRKYKHRLLQRDFLKKLSELQKPGARLELKTDSKDYFFWAVEELKNSPYQIERYTEDLHRSLLSGENFTTQFEKIFIAKGQPIYYLRAINELDTSTNIFKVRQY